MIPILDDWQKEILNYEGDIGLAKGRRIGATNLFAIKAIEHLMKNKNNHPSSQILCMSITEDQAEIIIAFALQYAREKYPSYIGIGADRPTKTKIIMQVGTNKRIMVARPMGTTGDTSRGFEGQILMIDEAAFHDRKFFTSATPILLTTGGHIWMWGTFQGKEGYFWDAYKEAVENQDPEARFKFWVKNTEEVFNNRPISETWTEKIKEGALRTLDKEKKSMTEAEYSQEYLAKPLDDIKRWFNQELIDKLCHVPESPAVRGKMYFGHDIARFGEDATTHEGIDKLNEKEYWQIHHEVAMKKRITETADRIIELCIQYQSKKHGIDTGGLGAGVYDILLRHRKTKYVISALNNASLALSSDGKEKKKLLKEEMYTIMLLLAQRGYIHLLDRPEIRASLASIQYEYVRIRGAETKLKITSKYGHIVEGLARAIYEAYQDQTLIPFVSYSTSNRSIF